MVVSIAAVGASVVVAAGAERPGASVPWQGTADTLASEAIHVRNPEDGLWAEGVEFVARTWPSGEPQLEVWTCVIPEA